MKDLGYDTKKYKTVSYKNAVKKAYKIAVATYKKWYKQRFVVV